MEWDWERRHRDQYGHGSRERAREHARQFVDWRMEQDCGIDAQERLRLVYSRPALEEEWAAETAVIALVLWRAAHSRGLLVDEVEVSVLPQECLQMADGPPAPAGELLPDTAPRGLGDQLSPELLHHVAGVLNSHVDRDRPGGTVGFRIREMRSTPGWTQGDWPTDVRSSRAFREDATLRRTDGRWRVTPEDLRTAGHAFSAAGVVRDDPALPTGPDGYRLWLYEARHLLAVGTALSTAAHTLPRTTEGYLSVFAMALSGHGGTCLRLRESTRDIEQLWAAEPAPPADLRHWDNTHVPGPLRAQTDETLLLISELRIWLESLRPQETDQPPPH